MLKGAAVLLLVAAVTGAGAWAYFQERADRHDDVARLEGDLAAVRVNLAVARRENTVLADRLRTVTKRVRKARVNLAPLAARLRRSVFTLIATRDEGTGFVGWVSGRNTYVLTANHVVVLSVERRELVVRLRRKGRVWLGRIVKTDPDNDLALVEVHGRIAAPLWQRPRSLPPLVGDELVLVGAPEGYEGSVTSGVVSRVSPQEIQTDASAHPGVSGGPLVDADGSVVGILVSGEGENLNFAVPIRRACAKLRRCGAR